MRCPRLIELPSPPPNKSGWPWTKESEPLPPVMTDSQPWPRVSIVTPSFNQGLFLEATIRSVLLQGYPNLEYIIMDGGSTDESIEIIGKYEPWLAYWVSAPDRGQSDAINKGFARASGEIFGWLNSDDIYEPGALRSISRYFVAEPDCALLYGNGWYIDAHGSKTWPCHWIRPFNRKRLLTCNFILQPAAFWHRSLWERTGGLDISYHWTMDWEWLIRATALVQPLYLPVNLAGWRITSDIKTMSGGQARRAEIVEICQKYGSVWQPTYMDYWLEQLARQMANQLGNGVLGHVVQWFMTVLRWTLQKTVWRGLYQL